MAPDRESSAGGGGRHDSEGGLLTCSLTGQLQPGRGQERPTRRPRGGQTRGRPGAPGDAPGQRHLYLVRWLRGG